MTGADEKRLAEVREWAARDTGLPKVGITPFLLRLLDEALAELDAERKKTPARGVTRAGAL